MNRRWVSWRVCALPSVCSGSMAHVDARRRRMVFVNALAIALFSSVKSALVFRTRSLQPFHLYSPSLRCLRSTMVQVQLVCDASAILACFGVVVVLLVLLVHVSSCIRTGVLKT